MQEWNEYQRISTSLLLPIVSYNFHMDHNAYQCTIHSFLSGNSHSQSLSDIWQCPVKIGLDQ
jgi:hypothetical protein